MCKPDMEDYPDLLEILRDARPYVQQVHDEAENRHDSYGEFYMDSVQYEIMQQTKALLSRIDKAFEP